MSDLATHRFGGYENLNLSQAEIAARVRGGGLPVSDRPLNTYQNLNFKPVRLMVNGVPTEFGVDIAANGFVQWRNNRTGVVTAGTTSFTGYSLFALAGGLGVGTYNLTTGDTKIAFEPTVWNTLPVGTGKFLKAQAIEHDYWNSNFGTNY